MKTYTVRRYFVVYDTLTMEAESEAAAVNQAMERIPPDMACGVVDADEWSSFAVEDATATDDVVTHYFDFKGDPIAE